LKLPWRARNKRRPKEQQEPQVMRGHDVIEYVTQQQANAYFVDPELRIEKRTGMYCQDGVTEKEYFCLGVQVNDMTERLDIYSVDDEGRCDLWGCYGTPIYAFLEAAIGSSCMYVLPPGKTYVIAYERRGTNPLIKVKKFKVIDPEHAEVLEEWSCDGPQCLMDAPGVVKRMCEG